MNGVSALIESPRELPSATGGSSEMKAIYELRVHDLGGGSLPDTESVGTLILNFPTSGTITLLFISHSAYGILL